MRVLLLLVLIAVTLAAVHGFSVSTKTARTNSIRRSYTYGKVYPHCVSSVNFALQAAPEINDNTQEEIPRGMYTPEEIQIRDELSGEYLEISEEKSFMFDNIDSFLVLSRDNTSVKVLDLYPFDDYSYSLNDEVWDKVGQIVGNLTELNRIVIHFLVFYYEDIWWFERRPSKSSTLTQILPHLRHKVTLSLNGKGFVEYTGLAEHIEDLAKVIYGHPMISEFDCNSDRFKFKTFDSWCSAMVTLPSLERVTFGLWEPESEEERVLLNVEPFKELLRTPALRVVQFDDFYFNNELCYAIANALEEGSSITDMIFDDKCAFPDGGRAIIANALKTNASVIKVTGLDP
jgi:hypothetical protein